MRDHKRPAKAQWHIWEQKKPMVYYLQLTSGFTWSNHYRRWEKMCPATSRTMGRGNGGPASGCRRRKTDLPAAQSWPPPCAGWPPGRTAKRRRTRPWTHKKKSFLSTNDDVSRRLHESWSFSQLTWGEHAKSPKARLELEISALRGAVLEKVLCLAEAGRDQKKIIHHSHQSSGRDRGGEKNDQLQHAALSWWNRITTSAGL